MLRPALTYFGLVFSVGFLLGVVRVALLAPALGERWAELLEMPVMLVAALLAARWVAGRFAVPRRARHRLALGLLALALLLAAELGVVLLVRDSSLAEYIAARDPVAGTAYLVALALFALAPWLVALDTLSVVRLVHTVVWAFFVGCILAIPLFAQLGRLRLAALFAAIVAVEVAILALNRMTCPLTDVAARYTEDRRANFDIYLPERLARHNKTIFGALYLAATLFLLARWLLLR